MAQAVAANEVDDEEHQQGAAYQDGDGDLQAQLQVTKIRNPSHHVRAETAEQLRCEHVDTNGSGVSAARHHVVKNGSDGAMIPRHEKTGDGEDAPVGKASMQAVRNESAGQDSKQRR